MSSGFNHCLNWYHRVRQGIFGRWKCHHLVSGIITIRGKVFLGDSYGYPAGSDFVVCVGRARSSSAPAHPHHHHHRRHNNDHKNHHCLSSEASRIFPPWWLSNFGVKFYFPNPNISVELFLTQGNLHSELEQFREMMWTFHPSFPSWKLGTSTFSSIWLKGWHWSSLNISCHSSWPFIPNTGKLNFLS